MALPKFVQSIIDFFVPNPMGPATSKLESGSKSLAGVEEGLKKAIHDMSAVLAAVSSPEEVKTLVPSGANTAEAIGAALLQNPMAGKNLLMSKLDVEVNGVTLRKTATSSLKTLTGFDETVVRGVGDITEGIANAAQAVADSASDPVKAAAVAARAKETQSSLTAAKANGEKLGGQLKTWGELLTSMLG
jgi:hypothetical protein